MELILFLVAYSYSWLRFSHRAKDRSAFRLRSATFRNQLMRSDKGGQSLVRHATSPLTAQVYKHTHGFVTFDLG